MTDEPSDTPEAPKPKLFHEWLSDHARGTLNDEATMALAEVVEAVSEVGKTGKLTIDIVVTSVGEGKRTVITAGTVKTKLPQHPAEASIFFVGPHGTLHRSDPFQDRLPGTTLPVEVEGPTRRIDLETGEVIIDDNPDKF